MALTRSRQWNGWNFFVCFLVTLGCVAFGYPSSIIAVTLAQPSFLVYMGLLDVTKTPPILASNASGIIGAMSGVCLSKHKDSVNTRSLIATGLSSRCCSQRVHRNLGSRQVWQKVGLPLVFALGATGWCPYLWSSEHWHVHRWPFLCRSWSMGISCSQ